MSCIIMPYSFPVTLYSVEFGYFCMNQTCVYLQLSLNLVDPGSELKPIGLGPTFSLELAVESSCGWGNP